MLHSPKRKQKFSTPNHMPLPGLSPLDISSISSPAPFCFSTEESPSNIRTPPPDRGLMEVDELVCPPPPVPPRSPGKRARRLSESGSTIFDEDYDECPWTSGDAFKFDAYISRSDSPTAFSGGDAGRLSFGVLDLSGTSDPTFENSANSDLSVESPPERLEPHDHSALIHSPKLRGEASIDGRHGHVDASPDGKRSHKDAWSVNQSAASPSRRLNASNASMISNMGTVVQGHRHSKSPIRHCSPLHPQRLFNGGQMIGPNPGLDDSSALCSAGEPAIVGILPFASLVSQSHSLARNGSPPHQRHNPFLRKDIAGRVNAEVRGSWYTKPVSLTVRSFHHDFYNFQEIGKGSFGKVYRCVRKIDLCPYAVKEITSKFRNERDREHVLREIYALATQGDNVHVVRYYNAWEQDDKLYIQMELCSGTISQMRKRDGPLPERIILDILVQLATGLAFMHAHNLAHLDIKPDNIYTTERGIFKLGDFGLVTSADAKEHVEEGDRRYLCREIIQDESCDLYKADIFSLGASIYEVASPDPLPTHGESYQDFRDGKVPALPSSISLQTQELIRSMLNPDPAARPSAANLVRHPLLYPLLRNESAACLRASPPKQRRLESGESSRREEQSQMLSALARALQAEKEVNRLKDRLYEAQQQLEVWRAKASAIAPAAPAADQPPAAANPFEPQRHVRSIQPVARPRQGMAGARTVSLSDVTAELGGAMEN